MKYLGIDYGTKRIGIATSDADGTLAFPLTTIEAGPNAVGELVEIVNREEIEKIILGESKNFKNEPNLVQENIEQFKKDIAELTQLPVEYQSELFSSTEAARQFAPDGSRKANASQDKLDASAAALILQSYLDKSKN